MATSRSCRTRWSLQQCFRRCNRHYYGAVFAQDITSGSSSWYFGSSRCFWLRCCSLNLYGKWFAAPGWYFTATLIRLYLFACFYHIEYRCTCVCLIGRQTCSQDKQQMVTLYFGCSTWSIWAFGYFASNDNKIKHFPISLASQQLYAPDNHLKLTVDRQNHLQ